METHFVIFSRPDPNNTAVTRPFAPEAVLKDGRWHEHPTHADLLFHESGMYVYDQQNQEHCRVIEHTFNRSGWVSVKVCFRGKIANLNVLALEAYEDFPLDRKSIEVCDHIDRNRRDTSIENLRRVHRLFNANNRRPFRVSPVTGEPGVTYRADKGEFVAKYQVYTLDERTISKTQTRCFSVKKWGYHEAMRLAIACRRQRHLNVRS